MNEYNPDKTLPPVPKPTETQRFRPVDDVLDKTNPNIRISQFPKGPEHVLENLVVPEDASLPKIGEQRMYEGSLKLKVIEVDEKGFVGEDENGARFFIERDKAKDFKLVR